MPEDFNVPWIDYFYHPLHYLPAISYNVTAVGEVPRHLLQANNSLGTVSVQGLDLVPFPPASMIVCRLIFAPFKGCEH